VTSIVRSSVRRPRTQTSAPLATPISVASGPLSVICRPLEGRMTTFVIGVDPTTAATPRAVSDGAVALDPLGGAADGGPPAGREGLGVDGAGSPVAGCAVTVDSDGTGEVVVPSALSALGPDVSPAVSEP
jgi:hypothetical protein